MIVDHPLSAFETLEVWERGATLSSPLRGALLLMYALPDLPWEDALRMPLGERDCVLLAHRVATYGSRMAGTATCPVCAEQVELEIDTLDLDLPAGEPDLVLHADGFEIKPRPLTAEDLVALEGVGDSDAAALALATRCIEIRIGSEVVPWGMAPAAVQTAALVGYERVDPAADIQIGLSCPECGENWSVALDVVGFYWSEIQTRAVRLMHQVHALAGAYGWTEAEILGLPAQRRELYLRWVLG
jgi:hypothetical protein